MNDMDFNKWAPRYIGTKDLVTGKKYLHYEGGEQYLIENGLLLDDGDTAVLTHISCAQVFLTQLKDGELNIHSQVRYLSLIHDLYEKVRVSYSPYHKLMPLFLEAMDGLVKISNEQLADVPKTKEDIQEYYYGYNNYDDLDNALRLARDIAYSGMFKEFARLYTQEKGFSGDLFGECTIELTNPQLSEFTELFSKTFKYHDHDHACFQKRCEKTWTFNFIKLLPMPNRYMLELAAYQAAAPFLSLALWMDVEVKHGLKEYAYA